MELRAASREELIRLVEQQAKTISEQQAVIEQLQARVEQLEASSGKPRGMPGNKLEPKKHSGPKGERKRREHNFVRRKATEPDERVIHAFEVCPGCGTGLTGGSVKRTREVIEVRPSPVAVIEHVYVERCCPLCERRYTPQAELEGVVVGKSRLGVGLVALIAALREVGRLPIATIKWYLETFHELSLSSGAIVGALGSVASAGQGRVEETLAAVRASPYINADETGWRENGNNGYVWVYSAPGWRYFLRGGRDKGVVEQVLGEQFTGVLVCDFYAAYNAYRGPIQRCWVHLLRDIRAEVEAHPDDVTLSMWAEAVYKVYDQAKGYEPAAHHEERRYKEHWRLREALLMVCRGYLEEQSERGKLCRRIESFIHQLFVFVLYPGVPSENNAAERDLRPLVTARKISGGTRSDTGTQTKMKLATLFRTWTAQGLNPFHACLQLLKSPQA